MKSIVVLILAAAWCAVLLPPLLRSRMGARPASSVDTFQERLSSLQRAVPSHRMPAMRMGRSLAGQRPSQSQAYNSAEIRRSIAHGQPYSASRELARPRPGLERRDMTKGQGTQRPSQGRNATPSRGTSRPVAAKSAKQRRQNVLFLLVLGTGFSLLMALSSKSTEMKALLAICSCSLIGYLYVLAQVKQTEDRRRYDDMWQYAD